MDALTSLDYRQKLIDAVLNGVDSPHTRRAYNRALQLFLTWHSQNGQPALNKQVVLAYKNHLQTADKTPSVINQTLTAIRKLVQEAADNNAIDPVLAAGIANIKGVSYTSLPAGRAITAGELSALLDICLADNRPAGARDAAMIALLYACGLRRAELVSLDLADFDAGGQTIRVRGKGRKERLTPVVQGAADALHDWLRPRGDAPGPLFVAIQKGNTILSRRLTTQAVYHILQHRAEQATVAALSPHDFRRTFVSDLLDAGADIVVVQKLAGHADVTTTARYDRRGEAAKKNAVTLLHVPYRRK